MKIVFASLFSLLLGTTLQASIDKCNPCPPCPPKDPCATCAQLWPSGGPDWIITPNAGPCVANGADLAITGDFLYWTVRQDHMAIGAIDRTQLDPPAKGGVFHPNWTMEPGFRVGLGVLFDGDGWDSYANYTWLRTRNTERTIRAGQGEIIRDIGWTSIYNGALTTIFEMSGNWHHDLNVVDLELGRNFFISQCLYLRPHFGFKGTWQEQKMEVGASGVGTSAQLPVVIYSNRHQDMWGVGIRAGLDGSWHFNRCFSFYTKIAATALWQQFKNGEKISSPNAFPEVFLYSHNQFHTIKPVLECGLGLRWEDWFCCDEYHYSIEAGWEEQWWGDQNQFFSPAVETRMGDLVMQGLTLKLRFDF